MDQDKIRELAKKYLDGRASEEEKAWLNTWYRLQNEQDVHWPSDDPHEENQVEHRMLRFLLQHTRQPIQAKHTSRLRYFQAAGVVVAMALTAAYFLYFRKPEAGPATRASIFKAPPHIAENRYITLPDSSQVLIHSGSQLQLMNDFNGTTREVSLIGEAYFDVKQHAEQPFIIHSNGIKTTVLGTSLAIHSMKGQGKIIVSVQSGSVKVEDGKYLHTVLNSNEQIIYDPVATRSTKLAADQKTIEWAREDMNFDNVPFGQLATRLSRRYQVNIRFADQQLAQEPISGGGFQGIESLEQVLDILCGTRNATYIRNGNQITISKQTYKHKQ